MTDQACKTPILDILRNTPKDAHGWWEEKDGTGFATHHHITYGHNAHEAADEIERLTAECARKDAAISYTVRMLTDLKGNLSDQVVERMLDRLTPFAAVSGKQCKLDHSNSSWCPCGWLKDATDSPQELEIFEGTRDALKNLSVDSRQECEHYFMGFGTKQPRRCNKCGDPEPPVEKGQ